MPLGNPAQKSQGGTFTQVGDEPLAKQVIGVRLPESIHAVVYPQPNRSEWLRRVITEAAQRELMTDTPDTPMESAIAEQSTHKNQKGGDE